LRLIPFASENPSPAPNASQPLQGASFSNRSAEDAQPPRLIEVNLPDERHHTVNFTFKVPSRDNWLASANRLLKLEWPSRRASHVYERLLKTNAVSSGLSKKVLETLPLPSLETIYRELWPPYPHTTIQAADEHLSLFLLAEEMSEFVPKNIVQEDIQLIGQREASTMHRYYYEGELTQADQIKFLAEQRYRTDFLESLNEASEHQLILAYLACRRLSRPLPWSALLESLSEAEVEKFPRLGRLHAILTLLQTERATQQSIQPNTLQASFSRMQALLNSAEVKAISAEWKLPRPVREVVLVEGATESLLLPFFAQAMGYDFNALGIEILPAGGKNHVLNLYREYRQHLAIPICVVLDWDAAEVAAELEDMLRPIDRVFRFTEGEFEDTYDLQSMLSTINQHYQPFPALTASRFREIGKEAQAKGRVQALRAVWQRYNLGTFDKIEFASFYAEHLQAAQAQGTPMQPPKTIRHLLEVLLAVRQSAGI
jgi:hypothetical protein